MAFEIHMLAVGAADAIIIRYIMPNTSTEVVILIDAGNRQDGPKIVEHINNYTNQKYIDLAICTHPDNDHIGGFFHVVENVRIEEFWIHDPSKHKVKIQKLSEALHSDKRIEKALKFVTESIDNSLNLLAAIDAKGINRTREPFTGLTFELAPFTVIGPDEEYYEELLSRFRDVKTLFEEEQLLEKSTEAGPLLTENLTSTEILNRYKERSKENNSSAILLFEPNNLKYLFTSDAGSDALARAAEAYDLTNLDWLDVPHRGSKYNLTTGLIKHFNPKVAFISGDGSVHYPNDAVIAELKAIGCEVHGTHKTGDLRMSVDVPGRIDYGASTPL